MKAHVVGLTKEQLTKLSADFLSLADRSLKAAVIQTPDDGALVFCYGEDFDEVISAFDEQAEEDFDVNPLAHSIEEDTEIVP